jgi:hypothetical protein
MFMGYSELTRMMFVTGLIRMRRTLDTKISPKNKLNKLKRMVQMKKMRKMRRKKKHLQSSNFQK